MPNNERPDPVFSENNLRNAGIPNSPSTMFPNDVLKVYVGTDTTIQVSHDTINDQRLSSLNIVINQAFFKIFMILSAVLIVGCDGLLSDAVWIQEKSIIVSSTSDFEKCISSAISDVPGVTIDNNQSQPGDIVLNVKLVRPIVPLGVYVRRTNRNVKVMFLGKGTVESDDERAIITPLLTSIINTIQKKCS